MKRSALLACAVAALALAACNKKEQQGGAAAANDTVKITQATPPPGGNWSDVVNATAAGFMMGNPNAKVKLVEIGALTCPHCREFDEKGVPTLVDKYVKSGQVSWEFRPYLLHGLDLPANLIARCNGAEELLPAGARAVQRPAGLDRQDPGGRRRPSSSRSRTCRSTSSSSQLANLAGLQDWAAARGVPQAKSNQCLRDENEVEPAGPAVERRHHPISGFRRERRRSSSTERCSRKRRAGRSFSRSSTRRSNNEAPAAMLLLAAALVPATAASRGGCQSRLQQRIGRGPSP